MTEELEIVEKLNDLDNGLITRMRKYDFQLAVQLCKPGTYWQPIGDYPSARLSSHLHQRSDFELD
jgi:hypothetical protein